MKRFTQFLIVLVIAILIIPLFLPNKITAETEKELNLPVGIVYEEFNNLKEYSEWEPWAKSDSTAKKEYFAPYRGEGAGYKWGNVENESQSGELTISTAEPNKQIEFKLEGLGLGKVSKMLVEFIPEGASKTKLKWKIESEEIGYFSRYYSYFTSKNIKEKLDEGLISLEERLKSAALTPEQANSLLPGMIKTEMFDGEKLITILNETSLDASEINTAREESLGKLFSYLTDFIKIPPQNIGKPTSYFEYIDTASKKAKFYCGYPITEIVKLEEDMQLYSLPAGKNLVCIHKGSYETLNQTIQKMKQYAAKEKLSLGNSHWESYMNDPEIVKDKNELLTKIYIPIK
ncbi:GyrI-like domain-containing protein [Moheibacter sediminis]|uniref:Effector-binding domain-containing protein n=1 Tax=Moheibacter sediminis TaxID=1434700 RepID=A0A1W1Z042_9FLAO|nr:GyrI-like domain-containing protein [Moheibacter sediminis]SMC41328.1 effector-binding domain-containing protein [Moheibacter sediminis]